MEEGLESLGALSTKDDHVLKYGSFNTFYNSIDKWIKNQFFPQ